jgi:transcriptional regulator with XRE-family HTH domain
MSKSLSSAIEAARKRLRLSKTEYAARVGLTEQGLRKILRGGGVSGTTLARLQRHGDVRGLGALVESLGKTG